MKTFKRTILSIFAFFLVFTVTSLISFYPNPSLENFRKVRLWLQPTKENVEYYLKNNAVLNKSPKRIAGDLPLMINKIKEDRYLDFAVEISEDSNFPKDYAYKIPGTRGLEKSEYYQLETILFERRSSKKVELAFDRTDPISEKRFEGSADLDKVNKDIKNVLIKVLENLKADKLQETKPLTISTEFNNTDNKAKLDGIEITKNEFFSEIQSADEKKNVKVSQLNIKMNNCRKENKVEIFYNYDTKKFLISDLNTFLASLCIPQFIESGNVFIGTCSDCRFFPSNKKYGLRADYVPSVTQITEIPGGQYFHTDGKNDLIEMYNAAKNSGYFMNLTSGYRSYYTQHYTFEAWVQTELAKGYDRATAEANANFYSARPGFSEHQIGTTIDIGNGGCDTFNQSCSGNKDLWTWLSENAYLYGFALSYPQGKEAATGYTYEPWHFRWLGKDLAKEYKAIENTTILHDFLMAKNLF